MSIQGLFNRKFYLILGIIFFTELLSYLVFLFPNINNLVFFVIVLAAIILSLIKLEYGLWLVLAELFIGSKGYLFSFDLNGNEISIRIALWLVVMSVWLAKVLIKWAREKKLQLEFSKSTYLSYFLILFAFIIWGVVNGFLNNNQLSNIFFDFNGWLYFTLIFPVFEILKNKEKINKLLQIFSAAILWLSIKTLALLFIFSHNTADSVTGVYRWIRVTGVGEITHLQGGFFRIFFQSHIFILIGFFLFFLLFIYWQPKIKFNKVYLFNLLFIVILLAVNIVNFSRSNWVGLVVGFIFVFFYIIKSMNWKKLAGAVMFLVVITILSIGLIIAIVKFPFPEPLGGFDTTKLLSDRASRFAGEAALSSRWNLYPELKEKILESPIIGHGFGATVTYMSSDPRVLELSPTGEFTTYAFEWGWLDIWIKLGILGLLIYLALIFKIFIHGFIKKRLINIDEDIINIALVIGLLVITAVSFFSPYMNHPLGIGYLIVVSAILSHNT